MYPINTLRNLAIENVRTTHFWLTDMDMWPSRLRFLCFFRIVYLREALMGIPQDQLERNDLAVIVPAFELLRNTNCGSFSDCAYSFVCCWLFM